MGYCFLNCGQNIIKKTKHIVQLNKPDLICCHSICLKTHILPGLIQFCLPMINNADELFRDYYVRNQIKMGVPKKVYFTQNRKSVESLNQSIEDPELFKVCNF